MTASPAGPLVLPPPSGEPLPQPDQDTLQRLLDDAVASNGDVGLTGAVVIPRGSWAGASGKDGSGALLRPEAAHALGSITKTAVAAAVMRLADEGSIDLDANAERYVDLPFDGRGATVRQLLAMESGYPEDPLLRIIHRVNRGGTERQWRPRDYLGFVAPKGPRQGKRGGEDSYNNVNFMVLGLLVEQLTGRPLAVALRRDLFEPARLDRVWLQPDERPTAPLARAAASDEPGFPRLAASGPYLPSRAFTSVSVGAGGMAADAATAAQWVYLLYGGRVIDPALVAELTRPEGQNDWYGLGTEIGTRFGERLVGHGGDVGFYHAAAFLWPDQQVAVSVLIPQEAGNSLTDARELAVMLADAVIDPDRLP